MPVIAPLFSDAKIYFILFGLLTAFGGIMGYVKAHSVPSLVAGGIAGVLLIVGALLIPRAWQIGAVLDLVVSFALLGRFAPALFRGKLNPAAYIVPLALIGVILALVLLFSNGAHP